MSEVSGWKKDRPTKHGHYWCRGIQSDTVYVVEVNAEGLQRICGEWRPIPPHYEWLGPISPQDSATLTARDQRIAELERERDEYMTLGWALMCRPELEGVLIGDIRTSSQGLLEAVEKYRFESAGQQARIAALTRLLRRYQVQCEPYRNYSAIARELLEETERELAQTQETRG